VLSKCYDPGDVPESESLPVPDTTTFEIPLVEVPVMLVVLVVAMMCSMLKALV
jgi:hypothetical protein